MQINDCSQPRKRPDRLHPLSSVGRVRIINSGHTNRPSAPESHAVRRVPAPRSHAGWPARKPRHTSAPQRHIHCRLGLAYSYHFTFSAATVALKYHSKFQNRPDHLGTVLANTMGILSVQKRCNEPELRVVSRVLQGLPPTYLPKFRCPIISYFQY